MDVNSDRVKPDTIIAVKVKRDEVTLVNFGRWCS